MNSNTVRDILVDMLVALDEFKSVDLKHYEKQIVKIMCYIKKLELQREYAIEPKGENK